MISAAQAKDRVAAANREHLNRIEEKRLVRQKEEASLVATLEKLVIPGIRSGLDLLIRQKTDERETHLWYVIGDEEEGRHLARILSEELTALGYIVSVSHHLRNGTPGQMDGTPGKSAAEEYSISIDW